MPTEATGGLQHGQPWARFHGPSDRFRSVVQSFENKNGLILASELAAVSHSGTCFFFKQGFLCWENIPSKTHNLHFYGVMTHILRASNLHFSWVLGSNGWRSTPWNEEFAPPRLCHPKRKICFQISIFRCYVSLREGIYEEMVGKCHSSELVENVLFFFLVGL